MANLSITAASVKKGNNAQTARGIAGVTITAGQVVYLNPATGKVELADANTVGQAQVKGVALHGALADQPVEYQYGGEMYIGASVTVGLIYCLSATAGAIAPSADLTSGDYTTILGVASTTSILKLALFASGAVQA